MWRRQNPHTLLVGYKIAQPLWKIAWKFLKKLNIELSFDPEIPLLQIYPRNENIYHRKTYTNVYASIIHNSQKVEINQISIN